MCGLCTCHFSQHTCVLLPQGPGRKIKRDRIYEALAEQDALFDYSVYPKF